MLGLAASDYWGNGENFQTPSFTAPDLREELMFDRWEPKITTIDGITRPAEYDRLVLVDSEAIRCAS